MTPLEAFQLGLVVGSACAGLAAGTVFLLDGRKKAQPEPDPWDMRRVPAPRRPPFR